MNTNPEKRACERHCYSTDIAFSYFNKKPSYNTYTMNIGTGGMCFKSNIFIQPGATLYVRLKGTDSNSPGSGFCEGLHIVTLAEVKWCQEVSNGEAFPYGVGVKYYETFY
jgi:hypothetical protein